MNFPLQIKDIKDDVEYYIENCREPDFMDNDMLYDDIDGLEEMLLEVNVRGYVYLLFCFAGLESVIIVTRIRDLI